MATLKYWLWLTTRVGLGTLTGLRLLERFGSPEQVYFSDPQEYEFVDGLSAQGKSSLADKKLDGAEAVLADCDRLGLRLLTLQDAEYPNRLRNIPDPPLALYMKGKLPPVDEELVIGMVGARKATAYGARIAGEMAMDLTRAGAVICSGMAVGIDTASIRGALAAGGTVISVVAGGIDVVYPMENRPLYEDVAATGVLLSEYPPGTRHKGDHFRPRNRIISGLSEGVVVVEGDEHSGALITARAALEQSREVFAVPGNVDSRMSAAPNRLIREDSARLVRSGADVLEEFSLRYPLRVANPALKPEEKQQRMETVQPREELRKQPAGLPTPERPGMTREEQRTLTDDQRDLLMALDGRQCHPDELVEQTQIPARRVLSALTLLQVRGYIKEETGKRFSSLVHLERL